VGRRDDCEVFGEKKINLPLPGMEPQFLGRPTHSLCTRNELLPLGLFSSKHRSYANILYWICIRLASYGSYVVFRYFLR
jgi:hypothetical protein